MSIYYNETTHEPKAANIVVSAILFIIFIWVAILWVGPIYRVWSATQNGKAELAQANQNRQIRITEAEAANVASISTAEATIRVATAQASAEIERAKGVAKANEIIGDSLKGNEGYLRYLYITGITEKGNQVIYVPTEGGLPILEAGKR